MTSPRKADFQAALEKKFRDAEKDCESAITITASELHRFVGDYPDPNKHRMPICCSVMKEAIRKEKGDSVLEEPPGGEGPKLRINYKLPRKYSMITHYGLLWSRRAVLWGKGGELRGRIGKGKERKFTEYKGIYCLYDGRTPVYIGHVGIMEKKNKRSDNGLHYRLLRHNNNFSINEWQRFSWFGFEKLSRQDEGLNREDALLQVEAISIILANPVLAKQSGTIKWAKKVLQVSDPKADGDVDVQIKKIGTGIADIREEMKKEFSRVLKKAKVKTKK